MASGSNWTREDHKVFENALAEVGDVPDKFQKIANIIGKTLEEVKFHYQNLEDDIIAIEEGRVPLPDYKDAQSESESESESEPEPEPKTKPEPKQPAGTVHHEKKEK